MEVVAKSVAQAAQVAGTKLAAAKAVVEPLAATAGSNALRAAEKLGSGVSYCSNSTLSVGEQERAWPRSHANNSLFMTDQALEHIKGHPIQAAAVAGGAVLMATPAGVALPVLNVVGFGSGGVAASKCPPLF